MRDSFEVFFLYAAREFPRRTLFEEERDVYERRVYSYAAGVFADFYVCVCLYIRTRLLSFA